MTEYLDPFDYIEQENIDEELEIALENPYPVNFRSNEPDVVSFEPEDRLISHVEVDLANRNVSVQYNHHDIEEKYVVIMKRPGLAMVKSHVNMSMDSDTETAVSYHIVTPELGLMYDGNGYTETSNDLPRQAAIKAPELLEQAEQLDEVDSESTSELEPSENDGNETSHVPPPGKDSMFED